MHSQALRCKSTQSCQRQCLGLNAGLWWIAEVAVLWDPRLMDHETTLAEAVRLAHACIEGELSALQTGREMVTYINSWHPVWDAMGGAHGPLAAFFVAQDCADRLHFLGENVERWHPDVREERQNELAEAEATATPEVLKACHALIDYSNWRVT